MIGVLRIMSQLPELVQALLKPGSYPHSPGAVELRQTQMSFLLLTGDYVYKVKKAVDFGYLDYTTLERRRFFCHQEVALNSRLCRGVYLEVVPIVRAGDVICVESEGEILEYAVKMRQLPREKMMDVLLDNNQMSQEMVREVAHRLAQFHQQAASGDEISTYGDLDTVVHNAEENFSQTEKYIGLSISAEKYQAIKAYTQGFIHRNVPLFRRRVDGGRIRDCHGDLHAAHVCFSDGICIYDCIEFNDRFRYCDVASEIAFLAMDLDHHHRPDLSGAFVAAYVEMSRDDELGQLLDFYKCYRAYVRGKVESFKLDDPHISQGEKRGTVAVARRYFELAESYTGQKEVID